MLNINRRILTSLLRSSRSLRGPLARASPIPSSYNFSTNKEKL